MKSITQVVQNLLKPYIDAKDKANAEIIAPVEVSPAEAAHSAGTQLIYDGKLYDVTAGIAIGDVLATTGAGANISLADDISTKLLNIKADYVGLYGETAISTATDLNTMRTIGNYYKASTSFAVTNAPTGVAEDVQAKFRLTVEKVLDSADSIVLQVLTTITGEIYFRIYGGASWGDWEEITTASALTDAIESVTDDIDALTNRVDRIDTMLDGLVYGFQINGSESDPAAAVTYLEDAVGMTPAHMDFSADKFDYGDWENAFFMPRPCMLKADGTVDYYLNPNDYTKKEDGTASDIADTTYNGNAMMEWGRNGHKIWLKILPTGDGSSAKVYISNHKADSKFFDYPFHNCKGDSVDHFYTPIYNGSVISNVMRSLSGQTVSKSLTGTAEITAAKANNPSTDELWNIECFADRLLINMLLILMGKSLNTQAVFGQGLNSGGNETINDGFTTGVHNAKGLFYGTNDGTASASTYANAVKIFGMENYYGFQWRRTNGLILAEGVTKYKLTYGTEDGSNATGYNTDGTNYKNAGVTPSGASGNYISKAKFTEDGMFSDTMSGSISTYYCDATWFNNSGSLFARFGGPSDSGGKVGAFSLALSRAVSIASWDFGAALSCKPLA